MIKVLQKLAGGDLRSIGKADEVVEDVNNNPALFKEIFEGIIHNNPLIRMRCADVVEKVSVKYPEYLQPYKDELINDVAKIEQQEVRWHVAQMFSYINVNDDERDRIIEILSDYMDNDKSKIVKTFSMQTLADFAERDHSIRSKVIKKIEKMMETGSPAILSRGRKLLKKLKKGDIL
jgi:hypothetical protein